MIQKPEDREMSTVSNQDAAKYQAALGCLGKRIARLSAQIANEKSRAAKDDKLIETLVEQREQLTDAQENLSPSNHQLISQLLEEG
jgi:hypothetical protein